MSALPLTVNALHKLEMKYHGKFVHTLGRIQHIALMSRIDICYTTYHLETQTVAPILPGFQYIKFCVPYLYSHPHKPIFYPSNYYGGSNFIRVKWSGNQVEDYKTQNCLEFYQDADHAIIFNKRQSVSGIIHTMLGVYVFCQLQIKEAIASDYTDGEIRFMCKSVKKNKVIRRYMEALAIHTCAPSVHWEDNTVCIYSFEAEIVTPRAKHI